MLGQILAAVLKVLSVVSTTLSISSALSNLFQPSQGGSTWVQLSNEVGTTLSEIENGTYGVAALAALVDAARTDILAAIGTPQQAGVAVTLPATAPSGYGGLDASATGNAVWTYPLSPPFEAAGDDLSFVYNNIQLTRFNAEAIKLKNTERFYAYDGWVAGGDSLAAIPHLNDSVDTIQQTDVDAVAWLNRINPTHTFALNGYGYPQNTDIVTSIKVYEQMSGVEFAYLRSLAFNEGQPPLPPAWPGIDGVTLLSAVPFTGDITVTEFMSGVLIEITSVPPGTSFFNFDGNISWRFLGALVFESDHGQFEAPQNLGFTQAVYCPKAMTFATAVALRVKPGVVGTVTPFTIP